MIVVEVMLNKIWLMGNYYVIKWLFYLVLIVFGWWMVFDKGCIIIVIGLIIKIFENDIKKNKIFGWYFNIDNLVKLIGMSIVYVINMYIWIKFLFICNFGIIFCNFLL